MHQADKYLINRCLNEIKAKHKWGNPQHWSNDTYHDLSDQLFSATGVRLSITTLKRLYGKVNYTSIPSEKTLNALAKYLGYEDWRAYSHQHHQEREPEKTDSTTHYYKNAILLASILTLAFISFFSMVFVKDDNTNKVSPDKIHFSSKPVTKGLPNSVVFDVELEEVTSENILIQQYWDKTKTIKIKPDQKHATGIYYYPGYFRAKLLIDDQVIKEHPLFIPSEEFISTIDYDPIPEYFSDSLTSRGVLHWPHSLIEKVAGSREPLTTTFHLVRAFSDISADDFRLTARLKHLGGPNWAVCQKFRLIILGTEGFMMIPFSAPGCISDLNLTVNEVYLNGKEEDLSSFGHNFTSFKEIGIDVQSKKVNVTVDDETIFQIPYRETMGRLVGFRIRFVGLGEVDHLSLYDGNREKIDLTE